MTDDEIIEKLKALLRSVTMTEPSDTREIAAPALSRMDLLQVLRESLRDSRPGAFYNDDDDTFELRWKTRDGTIVDFEFRLVAAYRYTPNTEQMVWEVEAWTCSHVCDD